MGTPPIDDTQLEEFMLDAHPCFTPKSMNQLGLRGPTAGTQWLWHGYLARRNITVFTSVWKSGKTTLLAGLLHHLANDGTFLGRACQASKVLVVSEEADEHWIERQRGIPLDNHVKLLSRPFRGNPTPDQWKELTDYAEAQTRSGQLDLLVVDPLSTFLPGRSEADAGTLLNFLHPLRNVALAGAAVLVLHHPRKEKSADGHAARGSGVLSGYADTLLELHRFGPMANDNNRRRLVGVSRWPETPAQLIFEWAVGTPVFNVLDDAELLRFHDNWELVHAILSKRTQASTHRELLADWPADRVPPATPTMYLWLNRAMGLGWVVRTGHGTKGSPYTFALPKQRKPTWDKWEKLPELEPM
jgi:hypothetical protein